MTDVPVDTVRPTVPEAPDAAALRTSFARSTASMTALTAVSRLTGFVRIVVVAAVLGTTFLGNTYESANSVPNLLFELIAAGVLQAVLIPTLVSLLDRGEHTEAEHVAGSVLGLSCLVLTALAVVGIAAAPLVARGLFAGVHDPRIRADEIHLATVFLWFFLPQVVMYAIGMVATSVLNAHNRFALPVFAPALNNVVVTVSYGVFWLLRDGKAASLHLAHPELLVLAGGTTLGVIAFCALPAAAVVRSDFRLRPNLDRRHPEVRRIGKLSAWAALFLAVTQLLLLVVLVLANRVEGGVIAYQVGFTFFLLPHALFALPVLTASFPALARQAAACDWDAFSHSIERGTRAIAFFVLPAAAGLTALAGLLARSILFGQTGRAGAAQVAGVLVGFAPGLLGYGMFLFLSRVMYARHDTRTPALVNVVVAVGGAAGMVVLFKVVHGTLRVPALALAHSVAYSAGAIVLHRLVRQGLPAGHRPQVLRSLGAPAAAAGIAGAAMWGAVRFIDPVGRAASL
ncbi:MAG: hypothetical protein M3Z46_00070, partial [Actinomycetota bacterium]|nr:hypothetical protein [Actinomycetota bacterium]